MLSTLRFDRRALPVSSLALAGAVMLAACDTDKSVGPNPVTSTPTAPSLAKATGTQTLTIMVVDQNSTAVTTLAAKFKVSKSAGGPGSLIVDNAPSDGNSAIGTIQMKGLASGTYEVCQTIAPTDYVLPATPCKTVIVGGIVAASVQFVDLTVARAKWRVADFLENKVGGAVIKVHDGISWSTITDNSALDLDPTAGAFEVKAPQGSYSICPKTPPTGWVFMVQTCIGMPTPHGQTTDLSGFGVNPEYSVNFAVTNYDVLSGPSAYEITSASGNFSAKLVDDGLNDRWTGVLGRLWITLPAEGEYTICQTVAPPNTALADPACKTIKVQLGGLEYAGLFNSKPL
jgi:hypothetical protein